MDRTIRRAWHAMKVPTFKMRVLQVSVVVLCLVAALGVVSAVVVMSSSEARDWSSAASKVYEQTSALFVGLGQVEKAEVQLAQGELLEANGTFESGKKSLEAALAELGSLKKDIQELAGDRQLASAMLAEIEKAEARVPRVISLFEKERSIAAGGGSPEEAAGARSELDSAVKDALNAVAGANEQAQLFVEESSKKSNSVKTIAAVGYPAILVAAVLLLAILVGTIYGGVSHIVLDVIEELKKIAKGKADLSSQVAVPTRDVLGDLGDAINELLSSLRGSMLEIRSISEDLAQSADALAGATDGTLSSIAEVMGSTDQIARGSEDQARKVERTSQAMGEVAQSIEGIADKGHVSAQQSDLTAKLAEGGVTASAEAAHVMREIFESVENSARLVEGLGERFAQIGIIIEVITDIAEQTNLLALNAAIEAARAGEHGRGFAVVAGEVRKLAENSKRSAEQISHLIREIMSETNRVITSMAESTNRVEAGLEVAEKTGEALEGIMESSQTGARAASEISSTIQAIAANTDQVFASINDIAAIAQEASASTEEVTATINEQKDATEDVAQAALVLAELASKLSELTEGFKL